MFSSTSITYQQPCLQTDTQLRVSVSAEVVLFKLREHHHIGGNNVLFRIYFPAPKKSKLVYVDTWSLKNCLTLPKPLNSGCGIDADIKSMVLMMDLPWYLLWGMSWSLGCENLVIWKDPPVHVGAMPFSLDSFSCSRIPSFFTGRSAFSFLPFLRSAPGLCFCCSKRKLSIRKRIFSHKV